MSQARAIISISLTQQSTHKMKRKYCFAADAVVVAAFYLSIFSLSTFQPTKKKKKKMKSIR